MQKLHGDAACTPPPTSRATPIACGCEYVRVSTDLGAAPKTNMRHAFLQSDAKMSTDVNLHIYLKEKKLKA
jgi:hypothetical protein